MYNVLQFDFSWIGYAALYLCVAYGLLLAYFEGNTRRWWYCFCIAIVALAVGSIAWRFEFKIVTLFGGWLATMYVVASLWYGWPRLSIAGEMSARHIDSHTDVATTVSDIGDTYQLDSDQGFDFSQLPPQLRIVGGTDYKER